MTGSPLSFRVPPVRKKARLAIPQELAFERFTARIAQWWPLSTHSVGRQEAQSCAIEPWAGGRVYEVSASGDEHLWGYVEDWEPPARLAMRWFPGRDESCAQRVVVEFTAVGPGETDVALTHSGWEMLGADAEQARSSYEQGWEEVLVRRFATFAGGEGGSR